MTFASLRIGTRGSPLALAQTHIVRTKLALAHRIDLENLTVEVIKTTGDQIQDRPLSEAGGKGLFTKELDSALLANVIDLAVHSSKDLPTRLPSEIIIAGYLLREDPRDALISHTGQTLDELAPGSIVGTASLRRAAQIKRRRPDLQTTLLRGNVETRLRKVREGEIDATLLAAAGLNRLGLKHHISALLSLEDFPPAVGQGAIGITCRSNDPGTRKALDPLLDQATGYALMAERAFLTTLDGSCRTPIAGYAQILGDELHFYGEVLKEDGSAFVSVRRAGRALDATKLGTDAGHELLLRLPQGVMGSL
jgi:hydroxymethylbilane synthase